MYHTTQQETGATAVQQLGGREFVETKKSSHQHSATIFSCLGKGGGGSGADTTLYQQDRVGGGAPYTVL